MNGAIAFFNPLVNNNISGKILFTQESSVLKVRIDLEGFEPNKDYAIHIHEFGDLSKGCQSLGPHFNPKQQCHGSDMYVKHHHAGDLMNNIKSNHKGQVSLSFNTKVLSTNYNSSKCILGRSVVIHYYADDLGQKGIIKDGQLVSYQDLTLEELKQLSKERKYPISKSKQQLVEKLNTESLITGNAGGRMACAIIGITTNS